jgi:hypothetical protein
MAEMMAGIRQNEHGPFSYRDHQMFMETDFPLPDFTKRCLKTGVWIQNKPWFDHEKVYYLCLP